MRQIDRVAPKTKAKGKKKNVRLQVCAFILKIYNPDMLQYWNCDVKRVVTKKKIDCLL